VNGKYVEFDDTTKNIATTLGSVGSVLDQYFLATREYSGGGRQGFFRPPIGG
jgi:hypothetical protein